MNAALVSARALRYDWGSTPCLDIPHLDLAPGEQVFLHGPSGSGKSTLLNLLAGVLVPQRGELRVLDTPFSSLPGAARDRFRADHIGLIFQQFNLIPYLSVLDNVMLPCRFSRRRATRAGAPREAAGQLLTQLDLDTALWTRPATALSVGQQQRVAAARALIGRPDLVIADEPTSALDDDRRQAFVDLLLSACTEAGSALVFVSHDRRLAARFPREVLLPAINRARLPDGGDC